MQAWEYKVEVLDVSESRWSPERRLEETKQLQKSLNRLGADGWEMVSYESVPIAGKFTNESRGWVYLLFFKRHRHV